MSNTIFHIKYHTKQIIFNPLEMEFNTSSNAKSTADK